MAEEKPVGRCKLFLRAHPWLKFIVELPKHLCCASICCPCYTCIVIDEVTATGQKRKARSLKRTGNKSMAKYELGAKAWESRESLSEHDLKPESAAEIKKERMRHVKRNRAFCDQTQSYLFRLPPELRRIIWELALSPGRIDFNLDEKLDMRAKTCPRPDLVSPNHSYDHSLNGLTAPNGWGSPGLIRSCRLIYTEVLPIVWAQNKFAFEDPETLFCFSKIVPSAHLARITRLTISCHRIAQLPVVRQAIPYGFQPNETAKNIALVVKNMPSLQRLELFFDKAFAPLDDLLAFSLGAVRHRPMALIVPDYFQPVLIAAPKGCEVIVYEMQESSEVELFTVWTMPQDE